MVRGGTCEAGTDYVLQSRPLKRLGTPLPVPRTVGDPDRDRAARRPSRMVMHRHHWARTFCSAGQCART